MTTFDSVLIPAAIAIVLLLLEIGKVEFKWAVLTMAVMLGVMCLLAFFFHWESDFLNIHNNPDNGIYDDRIDLAKYLGKNYDNLLGVTSSLKIESENSDEIKIGKANVSITALPNGTITRIRLNEGDGEFCVEGVWAGQNLTAVKPRVSKSGYVMKGYKKGEKEGDGDWVVYQNEANSHYLAYKKQGSTVTSIYCSLKGFFPIKYEDS